MTTVSQWLRPKTTTTTSRMTITNNNNNQQNYNAFVMANYAGLMAQVHELASQIDNIGNHQPRQHRDHFTVYDRMLPTLEQFKATYRLTPVEFEQLASILDPQIGRATISRKVLPTNLRVLIFLHFIAHGDSYRTLGGYYLCSHSCICNVISEVTYKYYCAQFACSNNADICNCLF